MIVRLVVRPRWWVRPYVMMVYAIASVLGREPDETKLGRAIRFGLVVELRPADRLEA